MTNAHERITLPPISSFDLSPSRNLHTYPSPSASGSRRPPHINGSPSWDGSSTATKSLRRELDPHDDTRRSPSTYDAMDCGPTGAHPRGNHSPYSEPAGLVERPTHSAPRPHSSSAALDRERRGAVVPYTPFHFAPPHSRRTAPSAAAAAADDSPDSRESHSRSSTHSPLVPTRSHPATPHHAVTTTAGTRAAPAPVTSFFNTTPGDAQDGGSVGSERERTSPVRKRKASEMLGTSASPGSEDEHALSPEPSESEAKKKYKKKMNVRHYRAQNKDAMTQLREALPEHMRPPERQAKAYVTLSAIKYIQDLTTENERLRAENVRQAQQLEDRHNHDPERSSSGEVAITRDVNDSDDDDNDVVPKAEVPAEGE